MAELSGLSARAAAEELNRRGIAATAEGGNAQKSSHPSARAASMKDGKATLVRCPICKAEAEEIDRGLFEGTAFDCKFSWPLPGLRHSPSAAEEAHPEAVGARADAGQGTGIGRPSSD
jgi:hypothetical protein